MQPHPRYEIVGAIASGDFATVYRGRDRELGREVAIKQIHEHFLRDPRRLESFWKEAQLLASLAHPHVMTIYDLVRERGWLILEFMQGNLQQYAGGRPLDHEVLRTALVGTLEALAFLHKSGVTHGDVKPSNLLIDRLNRIKLGDFGLARRASSEQGSMLKGTTKYMAPEMLSNQFGVVGPASDLYSLGFSAYELACGKQFDELFPGLDAFGTDRQIAWMMWHAAPDRVAPPLERVLPDLPTDLSAVIQRLIAKPQSQRYRTALEALRDLRAGLQTLPVEADDEAELAKQKAAARKKRLFAIGAFSLSAALSLAVLFWPQPTPPVVEVAAPEAIQGVVRQVTPSRQILILEVDDHGARKEVELRLSEDDRVYLNDKASLLRDLLERDRVVVQTLTDASGKERKEVLASRFQADSGQVAEIKIDESTIAIATSDLQNSKPLVLSVPVGLAITINERTGAADQPYTLASLKVGDAVQVEHEPDELGRHATKLSVTRAMTSVGNVAQVDAKKRSITWNVAGSQQRETLPVAQQCEISLNGLRLLNKAALTLQDLRPGDEVTLAFDTAITRIDAVRRFVDRGVVKNIAYDVRSIEVQLAGENEPRTFILPANCELRVPGGSTLDLLRRGDQIEVTHDSPEGNNIAISKLSAQRPGDASKWAIVIHQQKYDDERLAPAAATTNSQPALADVLTTCYAVPHEQVLLLSDESRIRLSKEIPAALAKAAQAKQLIVVYVGRGFADSGGQVFLSPKEFALDRVAASGVPLKWFIEQIEASPASEKLLLFDAGFELGAAPTLTSAEMIATIQGTRSEPGLRTTTVLASGGREALSGGALLSGYEQALATAFTGGADRNRDLAIDAGELVAFFEQSKVSQPVLFLPNNTPPRLTADAKQSLRSLAAILNQPKIDVTTVRRAYEDAASLSAKQPEAGAIYALLLLKARKFPESLRRAEEVKAAHPNYLPIYEINLWNRFGSRDYAAGITEMAQLATRLAMPAKENELAYSADNALRALRLAGQLREYAAQAVEDRPPRPEAIEAVDAAVAKLSAPQVAAFQAGRAATRKVLADFDAQAQEIETRLETLANEDDKSALTKVKFEKRQLRHYVTFGFDGIVQSILAELDE